MRSLNDKDVQSIGGRSLIRKNRHLHCEKKSNEYRHLNFSNIH